MCFPSLPTGRLFACSPPFHHFMSRFKHHFLGVAFLYHPKFVLPISLYHLPLHHHSHPVTNDSSWKLQTWITLHCLQKAQQVSECLFQEAQVLCVSSRHLNSFHCFFRRPRWCISFRQLGWFPLPGSSATLRVFQEVQSGSVSQHSLQLTYPWEEGRSVLGLPEITELFIF